MEHALPLLADDAWQTRCDHRHFGLFPYLCYLLFKNCPPSGMAAGGERKAANFQKAKPDANFCCPRRLFLLLCKASLSVAILLVARRSNSFPKMKYPYLLAIAVAGAGASPGFSQTPVPIANYSFQDNASMNYVGPPSFGVNDNPTYVTGWTTTDVSGGDAYSIKTVGSANGQVPVTGADGTQVLEDFNYPGGPADGGGSVYQVENGSSTTTASSYAAGTYTLTAYAGSAYSGGTTGPEIGDKFYLALASTPTVPIAFVKIIAGPNDTLSSFSVSLDNTSGSYTGAIVVGFQSPGDSTAQTNMEIDNFSLTFTAVPEPGSIACAALGGFGLLGGFLRRRRA